MALGRRRRAAPPSRRRLIAGSLQVAVGTLRGKVPTAIMRRMVAIGSSRRSQLLRGVLDVCLLAVIGEQPTYGYEMTKRLAERGLDIVGEGSIYPALARIERDGLVEAYAEASNGGPARKYYRLTPAGRDALRRWSEDWRATRSAVDGVLGSIETEVRSE